MKVVGDQIRLWESEQSRVRHCDACLFDNFDSDEIFNKTCNNARKIGVWLWQDSAKRRLVLQASSVAAFLATTPFVGCCLTVVSDGPQVTTMEGYDPMRKVRPLF